MQVAARSFGIPVSKIHISETSTNTVANTSPTAASASSDLNGMAVKVNLLTCNISFRWFTNHVSLHAGCFVAWRAVNNQGLGD